ncbi:MAG: amidohydrolase [Lachnospiraceae bacterium]|nr:amidohydrolase [Lachnospiraceae bacterium]
MNIRFYNARVLTMQDPVQVQENQELWVKGERILYVGGQSKEEILHQLGAQAPVFDREIDCKGNLLMPGFKNAHTHSAMVLFRSCADDEPLQGWLEKNIFPVEAKMTGEDCYELTKLAVLEYLTSGVTAVFDMYLTPETILEAFTDCGMRNVQVSGINNFGPEPEVMEERFLKLNGKNDLSSYMLGAHAEYTCSLELMEKIAAMVQKYKAPFFTHNSETLTEVQGCMERYGKTPTQLWADLGAYDFGGGGYHMVHVSDEDIRICKEKNLTVVTNPASNIKLASGIAPISKFMKAGVPVAIGTDGAGSNNCLDMFREMFLVSGLAKVTDKDASSVDGAEVLKMATVNGARAMGLNDSDVLAAGKYADLIMIDLRMPNMQPLANIPKNIVYSGSKQNVVMTMIAGNILYDHGRFYVGTSEEEIYDKANEIANRLMKA